MNIFCTLLGHTWIPGAENPKTAWNNDDDGLLLYATPASPPKFFEECVRCRIRRDVAPRPIGQAKAARPAE